MDPASRVDTAPALAKEPGIEPEELRSSSETTTADELGLACDISAESVFKNRNKGTTTNAIQTRPFDVHRGNTRLWW